MSDSRSTWRVGELTASRRGDLRDRQPNSKFGSAGPRFKFNGAVIVVHKAPGNVESEPDSLSLGFGSKEGIEDAVPDLIRNTGPVIENAHHHSLVFAAREDFHPSSMRACVQGIVNQISPP